MQMLPKPRQIKLKVLSHNLLNRKVVKVDFEAIEPSDFEFLPGQHVNLRIGESIGRTYSICSDLIDKKHFSIVVSAGHRGIGSNFLKHLQPGDEVSGLGPLGRFYIRNEHRPSIIFYASGTGISPILTMLYKLASADGVKSKIKLYWGLHSEKDIILQGRLEELKNWLDFDYEIFLSSPPKNWNGKVGYVTKDMKAVEGAQYYIFGVKEMVSAVKDSLKRLGVRDEDIIG